MIHNIVKVKRELLKKDIEKDIEKMFPLSISYCSGTLQKIIKVLNKELGYSDDLNHYLYIEHKIYYYALAILYTSKKSFSRHFNFNENILWFLEQMLYVEFGHDNVKRLLVEIVRAS